MKGRWKHGLRSSTLLVLIALLLLGLTACGGGNNDSDSLTADKALHNSTSSMDKQSEQLSYSVADQAGEGAMAASEAPAASAAVAEIANEGSNANAIGGGGIGPIADANAGFGRKVIYRADLVMKVKDFKAAEEQVLNQIHLSGAYVLQFSDSRNANEIGAAYVIKVPSEGFSPFLDKLQQIKSLKFDREVQGNDVTEEFVDLDARLKAKQTVEARLLSFMDKATKSDDLVRFSNELAQVQEEIEQIKGRIRYLDQNVAFSTINLRLYQTSGINETLEEDEEQTFVDRISNALTGSAKAVRQFGEGLIVVVAALLPVLAVLAIIGVPVTIYVRRRVANKRKLSKEPPVEDENKDEGR